MKIRISLVIIMVLAAAYAMTAGNAANIKVPKKPAKPVVRKNAKAQQA